MRLTFEVVSHTFYYNKLSAFSKIGKENLIPTHIFACYIYTTAHIPMRVNDVAVTRTEGRYED